MCIEREAWDSRRSSMTNSVTMLLSINIRPILLSCCIEINIVFLENDKRAAQWDSNPRHIAYEADALTTELPRQLSWLG